MDELQRARDRVKQWAAGLIEFRSHHYPDQPRGRDGKWAPVAGVQPDGQGGVLLYSAQQRQDMAGAIGAIAAELDDMGLMALRNHADVVRDVTAERRRVAAGLSESLSAPPVPGSGVASGLSSSRAPHRCAPPAGTDVVPAHLRGRLKVTWRCVCGERFYLPQPLVTPAETPA